jgi:hypothetical protein
MTASIAILTLTQKSINWLSELSSLFGSHYLSIPPSSDGPSPPPSPPSFPCPPPPPILTWRCLTHVPPPRQAVTLYVVLPWCTPGMGLLLDLHVRRYTHQSPDHGCVGDPGLPRPQSHSPGQGCDTVAPQGYARPRKTYYVGNCTCRHLC